MRVFILGTGRCGTYSFIEACKHINNYSAAHESRSRKTGKERFLYPDFHIEADNRLSWELGALHQQFSSDVFFVHLTRDRTQTAKSFAKRFFRKGMIDAFTQGIRMTPPETLNKSQQLAFCYDYIDSVTANIEHFLADKPHCRVQLENIENDFKAFWVKIEAQGDFNKALESFSIRKNTSKEHAQNHFWYHFKLFLLRQKQRFS